MEGAIDFLVVTVMLLADVVAVAIVWTVVTLVLPLDSLPVVGDFSLTCTLNFFG